MVLGRVNWFLSPPVRVGIPPRFVGAWSGCFSKEARIIRCGFLLLIQVIPDSFVCEPGGGQTKTPHQIWSSKEQFFQAVHRC